MKCFCGVCAPKFIVIAVVICMSAVALSLSIVPDGQCYSLLGVFFGEEIGSSSKNVIQATSAPTAPKMALVGHGGDMVDNEGHPEECLSCHDGIAAKEVGYQQIKLGGFNHANPIGNHSIGGVYPSRKGYVNQTDVIRKGFRFPRDNQVECVTCHDLRLTTRSYYLPASTDRGQLCLSCHVI